MLALWLKNVIGFDFINKMYTSDIASKRKNCIIKSQNHHRVAPKMNPSNNNIKIINSKKDIIVYLFTNFLLVYESEKYDFS